MNARPTPPDAPEPTSPEPAPNPPSRRPLPAFPPPRQARQDPRFLPPGAGPSRPLPPGAGPSRPLPPGAGPSRPQQPLPGRPLPGAFARPPAPLPTRPPQQAPHRQPLNPFPPRMSTPGSPRAALPPNRGFGLPSLRRNVCPHFYMTGSRGAIPIQAPHLLKGLLRQPNNVSRCQLRGGVHLDEGFVNDVCLTPRFNQCVFYEDELSRE